MEYGGLVLFKKELKMKVFLSAVSFFLLITTTNGFSADFLYHSDGQYKGKVIDLETGEPIQGAVVAGVWVLEFNFTPFCDAVETVTDKNGEFILPKASCFSLWPLARMNNLDIVVFKPGYLAYPPLGATYEERKAQMPGFTGDEFKDRNRYYIIRLGRPKTIEERMLTHGKANGPLFDRAMEKLPYLINLINMDRKNLGLSGKIGPQKRR